METHVRTPLEIFHMPQHLVVPVFQRRYVWSAEEQWEPLWRDIRRVAELRLEQRPAQHFLGAVVTQASPAGMGSLASHSLIDGQQRLTTLQLVVDASAAELENAGLTNLSQQLDMLTHNPLAYGASERQALKLQHENDDRTSFVEVMSAVPPIEYSSLPATKIVLAHQYFAEQVRDWLGSPVAEDRAAALVATLTQGLQLVVIALTEHEPSQEIFETLNARGTPLTAADLVKNYIFQQIVREGGSAEQAFRDHWHALEKPFWTKQVNVGRYSLERLSLFLNHWLVAQTGEEVSTRSTFTRFKSWCELSGRPMKAVLATIHAQAHLYETWVRDADRPHGDLDQVAMFVYRTEASELEAVKPILLRLFDVDAPLPGEVASAALSDVESWVMRRSLLRRQASEYSRTVAGLVNDLRGVAPERVADVVRRSLMSLNRPGTYWPGDDELRGELAVAAIYKQPKRRLRAYLEAIEDWHRGYTHSASASEGRVKRGALTIEHLLPQSWTDHWPVEGLEEQIQRDASVHRLGNLTLLTQNLNSSVSNGSWAGAGGKRASLEASDTLLMTRGPRTVHEWDEGRIGERTNVMVQALTSTWPAPAGHNPTPVAKTEEQNVSSVLIKDLVASGFLDIGANLVPRQWNQRDPAPIATVTADGNLMVDGKAFDTPSGAARAVAGGQRNGWSYWRLEEGGRLSEVRQKYLGTYVARADLYRAVWLEVLAGIKAADPGWTQATAPGSLSWMVLPFGSSAARYALTFTVNGPAIDLEFATSDAEANLREYNRFFAHKDELERAVGGALSWQPLQEKISCRIRYYSPDLVQVTDTDKRDSVIDWFIRSALRFREATQMVKNMV